MTTPHGSGAVSTPNEAATQAEGQEVAVSSELAFTATTLDGKMFDGASLAGKPVVLWFWAPWCSTCRAQSPNVSALAEKYAGKVAVVGVGGLDSAGSIEDVAEQIPYVTHLVDEEGSVWRHFGVTAQSSYTVIDAQGKSLGHGYLDDAELNDLVARLAEGA